jgi:hypothetical protein
VTSLSARLAVFLVLAVSGLGCARGEVKGTYSVELLLAGAVRPFEGTLILSTRHLDIPSLVEDDPSIDPQWFGGDALSANSCFILSPQSGEESGPGVVRVFEARIQSNQVSMPIEILNATDLRIEIVKLQFFANALGGELLVHTQNGSREGRIHGARVGAESPERCAKELAAFRALLRSPTPADGST